VGGSYKYVNKKGTYLSRRCQPLLVPIYLVLLDPSCNYRRVRCSRRRRLCRTRLTLSLSSSSSADAIVVVVWRCRRGRGRGHLTWSWSWSSSLFLVVLWPKVNPDKRLSIVDKLVLLKLNRSEGGGEAMVHYPTHIW
jgi:hypothetical protein